MSDASPERQTLTLRDELLRRPAFVGAIPLILGIVTHHWLHLPAEMLLTAIAALTVIALLARARRITSAICLAAALFLTGAVAARLQSRHFAPDHIAHFAANERRLARIEMLIIQPPRTISRLSPLRHESTSAVGPIYQATQARVTRIRTRDGWKTCSGTTLLHIDHPHPHAETSLSVGQRIEAFGMLQRPTAAQNPGEFDWQNYYRDDRILTSLHVAHAENIRLIATHTPGPIAWLQARARAMLAKGFDTDHALDHALLRALVLGDTDPQLRDVQDDFQRTGTSHHLAISGAHVMILGLIVFGICRLLLLSPRLSVWIGLTSVILYGLVALPSPPVIRSVLLSAVLAIGLLRGRSIDGVQMLSVSIFLMLVVHPLDLYNAGFQLSFVTVLGLMTLTNPAVAFLGSFEDPDVKIARQARPPTGVERWALKARAWLVNVLVAGVVAWVVSAPLIAIHFSQMNPWGIPASLLLAPVVVLALIAGVLKILLTILLPFAAQPLAAVAAAPIRWMRQIVDWLATLPGHDQPLSLSIVAAAILVITAYVMLFLPLIYRPPRLRWCVRCAPATAFVGLMVMPLLAAWAPRHATHGLRLTLLSVGAGQCAALHLPSGKTLLLDAGSSSINDLARRVIVPYLRHHGLRGVDSVIVSHANYDHYSAVPDLLINGECDHVFVTDHFLRHARDSAAARAMLEVLTNVQKPRRVLAEGDELTLDDGVTLHVLWPPKGEEQRWSANDSSLVLRLTCAGRSILFTGDIQEPAMRQLLLRPERLKADILIAPHHGSTEASTAAFIAAVAPQLILSSNDRTLSQKQRALPATVGASQLLRTHDYGAITITVSPDGKLDVETFASALPRLQ